MISMVYECKIHKKIQQDVCGRVGDVRGCAWDVRGRADSMLDVRLVFQVFELNHDFCGHVQKIAELDDGNMLFAVILDVF